jgi:hypothetical protein
MQTYLTGAFIDCSNSHKHSVSPVSSLASTRRTETQANTQTSLQQHTLADRATARIREDTCLQSDLPQVDIISIGWNEENGAHFCFEPGIQASLGLVVWELTHKNRLDAPALLPNFQRFRLVVGR